MIYIIGVLVTLLFAYIGIHIEQSKYISYSLGHIYKCLFTVLSTMPLLIISAARYAVGSDFFSYYRMFEKMYLRNSNMEIGFLLFIQALRKISANPQFFIAATSFVVCVFYFYAIYKNSVNPVYSILLFVVNGDYFMSMNAVRQAMAMTIVLFSIPYIRNRKWIKAFLIIGFATLFHKSAFIFIVLYFLVAVEWKPIIYMVSILATFVLAGLLKLMVLPFLQRFTSYGRFFLENSRYSESNIDWARFLIYLSFFIVMTYKFKIIQENINLKLMYSSVWMALIIVASGISMPTTVVRLAWYMNPIIAIYTPELTSTISQKQLRNIVNFLIISLYIITCIIFIRNGWHAALPYQTFWDM